MVRRSLLAPVFALISALILSACGGGSSSTVPTNTGSTPGTPSSPSTPSPPQQPEAPSEPPPPATEEDSGFATPEATARFLTQATFGPSLQDIDSLTGTSASAWFLSQLQTPASLNRPRIEELQESITFDPEQPFTFFNTTLTTATFWENAINGQDQLRQRMAFALSEILVVSSFGGDQLNDFPEGISVHQDNLATHALGNYRELLEDVTYSPAMGIYLTYQGNLAGDPETGRMPDENYAREILQLFTVGLVSLNMDGSVQTDAQGNPIELYNNQDITGLARVFTGIDFDYEEETEETIFGFFNAFAETIGRPMVVYEENHSRLAKTFLGTTIAEGTNARTSVSLALDHIMAQPSVAPFIARQLIQRLVTSNPSPGYIERVATAFESGQFQLPSGDNVGEASKGDLAATAAAILFDPEARAPSDDIGYGKIREPVLRFSSWARAFDMLAVEPAITPILWDTSAGNSLGQHPYRARSVFNFFRPGYVAPGTASGAQGLTVPELQIMNASTTPGYINFITYFTAGLQSEQRAEDFTSGLPEVDIDLSNYSRSFVPDYSRERELASDPQALVDHLDTLLTFGRLSEETRNSIIETINDIPPQTNNEFDGIGQRVFYAVTMMMTSPDFLVQR